MKLLHQTCLAALALLMPASALAADVKVTVTNEQKTQRQELVEIDSRTVYQKLGIAEGQNIIVKNAMRQQVAYQITYDGKLLIDAAVKPCGKTVFTITPGNPEPMRSWVEGKMYPLRKDDIAWENDRGAYRVYGPQLQKSGERSFGIDVWTKNSPDLNVPERYYKDYEGNVRGYEIGKNGRKDEWIDLHTSFHLDHGKGLDCYGVGPSLGCGTPALMDGDKLIFPYCYRKYRIVDNGPLRFTVELTYNPVKIKNDENVVEHRIISLDKGSNFNKMTVWYSPLAMRPYLRCCSPYRRHRKRGHREELRTVCRPHRPARTSRLPALRGSPVPRWRQVQEASLRQARGCHRRTCPWHN